MALTPAEYQLLLTGWEWRTAQDTEAHATWAAVLINGISHRKTPITAEQILGRPLTGGARAKRSAEKE